MYKEIHLQVNTPYINCIVHFVKVVTHQLYVTIIH